ncbi:arylesterase [Aequorivita viscosa]|uniref:Acyl-CoA thioesterase-1 n=1 Tax=Aequorivita viscosa TaxID=797419 RepID=A0A1M6MPX8_9FLAO|nr:arylesterase [Aequorivita viscosa]SDX43488.1 acyl-CoA thioesterase-1 [Aequorivita viscosa]SHJ85484.1 acyl-CoA thioesterase-1 [Aequorivita viscosa]
MFQAHNNQFQVNIPSTLGLKFIKFSYFFIVVFLISCADSKPEKVKEKTQTSEQTENTAVTNTSNKTILCFGDSITAGYGLNDSNDAYPAILQQKIDSLNLHYTVINSGVSGETTAGGKSRINWVIKQNIDIFLLELGANDGLRGVSLSETRSNLQAIIDEVREKSPKTTIILAGMELPPNMGQEYTAEFRQLYSDLAEKNKVEFIPFILKDVGGIASLNQSDGIHPTAEGHKIVANTVWETLKPLLVD